MKRVAALAVILGLLAGCAQNAGNKETTGAILGGAAGGLLGSQFGSGTGQLAATAAGALGGLLLGSSIGRTMDDVDKLKHKQAASTALETLPSGNSASWSNPDTGHSGSFTPTRTYQRDDGVYCREFTQTIDVGGKPQQGYGTACRQPDGTWQIVS